MRVVIVILLWPFGLVFSVILALALRLPWVGPWIRELLSGDGFQP